MTVTSRRTDKSNRSEQYLDRRLARTGLRPRDAAYLIGSFWAVAVVVFGATERLVDLKTFHSVWLRMWWGNRNHHHGWIRRHRPRLKAGKIIAGFLMLGGLSLLSGRHGCDHERLRVVHRSRQPERRDSTSILQKLDQLAAEPAAVKTELSKR